MLRSKIRLSPELDSPNYNHRRPVPPLAYRPTANLIYPAMSLQTAKRLCGEHIICPGEGGPSRRARRTRARVRQEVRPLRFEARDERRQQRILTRAEAGDGAGLRLHRVDRHVPRRGPECARRARRGHGPYGAGSGHDPADPARPAPVP